MHRALILLSFVPLVFCGALLLPVRMAAQSQPTLAQLTAQAQTHYTAGDYAQAHQTLSTLDSLYAYQPPDSTLAQAYYLWGHTAYRLRDGATAVRAFTRALSWFQAHPQGYPRQQLACHEWLGNVYRYTLRQPYPALPYYEKALAIAEAQPHLDGDARRRLNYNLAATYRLTKDVDRALRYGRQALRWAQQTPEERLTMASHQNQMGTLYMTAGEPEQALPFFRQALTLLETYQLAPTRQLRYRDNLADAYLNLQQWAEARQLLEANQRWNQQALQDTVLLARGQYLLAQVSHGLGDSIARNRAAETAIALYSAYLGPDHVRVAEVWRKWGAQDRELSTAQSRRRIDEALRILWPGYTPAAVAGLALPDHTEWEALFVALGHRAYISRNRGALDTALHYHQRALDAYQHYRNRYLSTQGMLSQAALHNWLIAEALGTLWQHPQLATSDSLRTLAWQWMELGKGALLQRAFQAAQVQQTHPLPDSLWQARQQLVQAQNQLRSQPRLPDSSYAVQRALDGWHQYLQRKYPTQARYLAQAAPVPWAQLATQLPPGTLLINYWEGPENIYVLGGTAQSLQQWAIPKTNEWEQALTTYLAYLQPTDPALLTAEQVRHALEAGHTLYRQLMGPYHATAAHRLVVFAHGRLETLAWEALPQHTNVPNTLQYAQHPYLVHRYAVSYGFSGSQWYRATHAASRPAANYPQAYAGLAWAGGPTDAAGASWRGLMADSLRMGLAALPGTGPEVQQAAHLWQGPMYAGNEATEHIFRQSLGQAQVLHVALHGLPAAPPYGEPALVFPGVDSIHDGVLYLQELYTLPAIPRALVLSACQTGEGTFAPGEGTLSVARGFAFSGCPSLVSSLWPLYDGAAERLITPWHQHAHRGQALDLALQASKQAYLAQAPLGKGHPSYWASLVLLGAADPLYVAPAHPPWLWAGCISLLLITLGLWAIRRRN